MSVQGKKRSASGSESLRNTPAYGAISGIEQIPELLILDDPSKHIENVVIRSNRIPYELQFATWDRWIGPSIVKGRCLACKHTKIKRDTFQCVPLNLINNHTIENLRPVCMSCYSIMKVNKITFNEYIEKLDL
jgi:hypothetical protein